MKGLSLAFTSFICLLLVSMILLRIYRGRKYFKVLIAAFGVSLGIYIFLYRFFPHDLWLLSLQFLEPHSSVDFWNGLLVLALVFHSFWNFLYATALTGFSSNLLVLLQDKEEGLSLEEILTIYGAGRPLDPILSWRINNLVDGDYIVREGESFRLLPKGRIVGRLGRFLKEWLGTGEGG